MTFKDFMKKLKKYRKDMGESIDNTEVVLKYSGSNTLFSTDKAEVRLNPMLNLTMIKVE